MKQTVEIKVRLSPKEFEEAVMSITNAVLLPRKIMKI